MGHNFHITRGKISNTKIVSPFLTPSLLTIQQSHHKPNHKCNNQRHTCHKAFNAEFVILNEAMTKKLNNSRSS